jgi:hypothetical protein
MYFVQRAFVGAADRIVRQNPQGRGIGAANEVVIHLTDTVAAAALSGGANAEFFGPTHFAISCLSRRITLLALAAQVSTSGKLFPGKHNP